MPIDSSLAPFEQAFTVLWPSEVSGLPGATSSTVLSLTTVFTVLGAVPRQRPTQNVMTFCSHLRLRCFLAFRNRDDMSVHILMSIPSWLLDSVDRRCLQHPGSSTTLGPLGFRHQWRHKSRASLRGPPCAHGVAGTPHREVRDTKPYQMESMPSSTLLKVGTPNLKLPSSFGAALCFHRARPPQCILKLGKASKGVVPRWSI